METYKLLYDLITMYGWVAKHKQNPPSTILTKYYVHRGVSVQMVINWTERTFTLPGFIASYPTESALDELTVLTLEKHSFTRSIMPNDKA